MNRTNTLSLYNNKLCLKDMATPIILLCLLIPFLFSCSSTDESIDTPSSSDSQIPIGFDTYIGRDVVSRGTVLTTDNLGDEDKGFGVFAMLTTGNKFDPSAGASSSNRFIPAFMTNFKVTKSSDGNWEYSPRRYWPGSSNQYVSFFVYAPYNEDTKLLNGNGAESGNQKNISHTVASTPSGQIDLMYCDTEDESTFNQQLYVDDDGNYTKTSGISDDNALKLNFKHACSRIGFVITSSEIANKNDFLTDDAEESDTKITVNSVELYNDDGPFYQTGLLRLYKGTSSDRWFSTSGNQNFSFISFVSGEYKDSKWSPTETTSSVIQATKSGTGYESNYIGNSAQDYLFIIPMTQRDVDGNIVKPLYCRITYTISYGKTSAIHEYTASSSINYTSFDAGNAYLIKIDITSLNAVNFSVENDPSWGNESTISVSP